MWRLRLSAAILVIVLVQTGVDSGGILVHVKDSPTPAIMCCNRIAGV